MSGNEAGKSSYGWDVFDLTFTPSPVDSRMQEICMLLSNTGKLPVNFTIKFPNDSDIEVEPWADPGEPTPEELMRTNILDSQLFDVQPRRGSLAAGESLTLRVSYKYTMLEYDGVHVIPVELNLENGKSVILRLVGKTLARDEATLFLGGRSTLQLVDVPIGVTEPCLQSFEVQNTSAVDVDVRLDTSQLESLVQENYGFPVLQCTSEGETGSLSPLCALSTLTSSSIPLKQKPTRASWSSSTLQSPQLKAQNENRRALSCACEEMDFIQMLRKARSCLRQAVVVGNCARSGSASNAALDALQPAWKLLCGQHTLWSCAAWRSRSPFYASKEHVRSPYSIHIR